MLATMPRTVLPVQTRAVRRVAEGSTVAGFRSPSAGWAEPGPTPILVPVAEDRGRVVVADDDVLLRGGLARLLIGSCFDVVGRAGDPADLLALAPCPRPN